MSSKALVLAHKAQDMTAYTQLLQCHIIIAETVPGLRDTSSGALAAHGFQINLQQVLQHLGVLYQR